MTKTAPTQENGEAVETSYVEEVSRYETVKLSRPVRAHGADLAFLKLREPTMGDLMKLPAQAFQTPILHVVKIVAMCADVPDSTIQQLVPRDMLLCTGALQRLGFTPGMLYELLAEDTD